MRRAIVFLLAIFIAMPFFAQMPDWTLKFSSALETDGKSCAGALVTLSLGTTKVATTVSGNDGNFVIDIPPNGEYLVTITKDGCNTKRFYFNTNGVPPEMNKNNFKAVLRIEAINLSKPIPTVDYSAINQPMVKVSYFKDQKKFTDDAAYTNQMLSALTKIREAERIYMEKYNAAIKAADGALSKNDCENAKLNYETASGLLPDEKYPKDQLLLVDKCFKQKEEQNKKNEAEAAAKAKAAAEKAAAEKLAADKAAADKAAKELAAIEKEEAEIAAKEKAAEEKVKAEAAAKAKAAADKIAAEKAAAEKAEADKLAKEKAAEEKLKAEAAAKEKAEADKIAAEKLAAEKAEADRLAKEKAAEEKAAADKIAAEKAASEKLEKEKAAAEKAAADKLAAEKAAAEKAKAEQLAAEKLAAEKAAKEKEEASKNEAEKIAKQKAEAAKAAKELAAIEKAEAELAAKEKAAEEKAKAEFAAKAKAEAEKAAKTKAAAEKAEADKIAKEQSEAKKEEERIAKEKATSTNTTTNSGGQGSEGPENVDSGPAKHAIPQTLGGSAAKYKEALNKAEGYFKMKRYTEAKTAYEDVLKIKPEDSYSKNKLLEIEKLISK